MKEDLIRFGAEDSMIGVLTAATDAGLPRLGCLLPNIGLAHRIGPHRINVKIARKLAACGFSTLRFDLSGIGDSPTVRTSDDVIEQAVTDMRAAMDYMQANYGIKRFIVFGICSGAHNGYFLALKDERIAGLLMYDGFDFPSVRSRLDHHAHQFHNTPWPKIGRRIFNRLLPRSAQATPDIFVDALNEMHPSRDEFRNALQALTARGTKVFAFFSGSRRARDKSRGLLAGIRNPALLDRITYRFEGDMDHTATSSASQTRLLSIVSDWALQVAGK